MALPSLTIQPSAKDTHLLESAPTSNQGSSTTFRVRDCISDTYRDILEFSLSTLTSEKTPVSATLYLYYFSYVNTDPVGKTVWAYKLSRTDWVEGSATWNIYKTGSNWTSAGGDYVTSSPSGGSTTFPGSYDWMTWDILNIVTDAHDNTDPLELLIKFATEGLSSGYSGADFYSNDYTTDTSKRPKLIIEYITPPTNISATKGTCSDKVVITWDKVTGVSEYQVYRDDVGLGWLGDVDTFDDENADAPVITPGTASASRNKKYNSVVLNNSGESIADGTTHTYKVRCRYSGIESEDSDTDTGYKGASTISYQWQRSAADSDASYSDLTGATTKKYYDYTGPDYPTGRYYRCEILAYGSTEQYSTAARGYRRDPSLPSIPRSSEVIIKGPDGNTLAYAENIHGIATDYRVNELATLEFTVPADSSVVEYLVYPNEAWLYEDGELQDIFKIIDTHGKR